MTNVLWVPELKRSMISVSMIEKKVFDVAFQDGKALIITIGSSSNKATVFRVRERNLYMLKGKPMLVMTRNNVGKC